jgi:hypothetical protein
VRRRLSANPFGFTWAMKYEKTQKGNPHGLTVQQHTVPVRSIRRFSSADGTVHVRYLRNGKELRLRPEDQLFCAKRTWDERAERGFMKVIEDDFQALAERVVSGATRDLGATEGDVLNAFVLLCNARAQWKASRQEDPDLASMGIVGVEQNPTKDEQELLEKSGIAFTRPDLTTPSRWIVGAKTQVAILAQRKRLRDVRWGILRSSAGELILPDMSPSGILRITPTVCVCPKTDNAMLSEDEVRQLNKIAIARCVEWYLARDFAACP